MKPISCLFVGIICLFLDDVHASCVRYECELMFEEVEIKPGVTKDKAVLKCENYPYYSCGPGEPKCGGHCINHPGHPCHVNSDCDGLDEDPPPAPAPAPPPPAPVPIYVPVPAGIPAPPAPVPVPVPRKPEPTPEVCWHVPWPEKEECENLGDHIPGQCYGSHSACHKAGGENFLTGLCGGKQAGCGCCLWPKDSSGAGAVVVVGGESSGPKTDWPSPSPTFCCPEFVEVSESNLQLFLILFLVYIIFNATVILISRWLIRRRARLKAAESGGAYSGIENGQAADGAGDSDDDRSDPGDDPETLELKRRRRKQRKDGVMWDDCCGDFEWWECSAWVRYSAWLFVEALVLPCVLCFLCANGGAADSEN